MLHKRWITLTVVYSHPFASKAIFLSDFEGFWVRRLLFVIRIQRWSDFPPENHIAPLLNFAAKRSKDSLFFSYLPIDNPSKRPGASPRRILKSPSFWTVKMRSKIHTCQSETFPLIASLTKWLNNNWFKEDLVSVYCLTTSNRKRSPEWSFFENAGWSFSWERKKMLRLITVISSCGRLSFPSAKANDQTFSSNIMVITHNMKRLDKQTMFDQIQAE